MRDFIVAHFPLKREWENKNFEILILQSQKYEISFSIIFLKKARAKIGIFQSHKYEILLLIIFLETCCFYVLALGSKVMHASLKFFILISASQQIRNFIVDHFLWSRAKIRTFSFDFFQSQCIRNFIVDHFLKKARVGKLRISNLNFCNRNKYRILLLIIFLKRARK